MEPLAIPTFLFYLIWFFISRKEEDVNEFVSAVCWKQNSNVIVAANSQGTIKVSHSFIHLSFHSFIHLFIYSSIHPFILLSLCSYYDLLSFCPFFLHLFNLVIHFWVIESLNPLNHWIIKPSEHYAIQPLSHWGMRHKAIHSYFYSHKISFLNLAFSSYLIFLVFGKNAFFLFFV